MKVIHIETEYIKLQDLRQNILTGHILVNHAVDGLHLSNDFFQTAMQVLCIHALLHLLRLHTIRGMFIIRYVILFVNAAVFPPAYVKKNSLIWP